MKALTDKIIEALDNMKNITELGKDHPFCKAITESIKIIKTFEEEAEFEEIARVMMKHLGNGNKYHPHHTVIITNSTAELVEGKQSVGEIMDYVPD